MSMFNHLPVRLLFLSATIIFSPAQAAEFYTQIGASINRVTIANTEFTPRLARIRAGYEFSKYAIELHYASGTSDDTIGQNTVNIDQQVGAYFRINYGLDSKAKMFLSLGVAQTSLTYTVGSESDDYQDFSYSFGIEDYYPWVDDLRLVLEYSEYYKDNKLDIKGLNMGIRYNF